MSEDRKIRQQEREPAAGSGVSSVVLRKVLIVVAIIAVIAGIVLFTRKKQSNRMDAFARCLGEKGAKMYGAYWCPHCADQKELFGPSFKYAPYVECGIQGSRATAQVCTDAGVKRYPTWTFADGARVEGEHQLDFLGQETGCPVP